MRHRFFAVAGLALALLGAAPGCRSVYYDAMEYLGKEKRDLLRSELEGMVGDQEEAEETFADALSRVKALTNFSGGKLEQEYDRLKSSYDDAEDSASQIDSRIGDIETVAADLFEEWEAEIGQISTASLKDSSRRKLQDTKRRYMRVHGALAGSRNQMKDVLTFFRDHVLYLKHNLNAAAVGSLEASMGEIEGSIEDLQKQIQKSIREAQSFLENMP